MNQTKTMIISIALLSSMLFTTSLFSQQAGFNDSVKLKNGTILENVKAVVTKDSLVVTQPDGTANVYTKKEVAEVKKNGGKFSEAKKTPANTSSGKWSEYQGEMNWNEAMAKCKSLGMRLPTKDELLAAYNAGDTESWKKDGGDYWPSTPYGDDAYSMEVNYGSIEDRHVSTDGSGRSLDLRVRCTR